MTAQGSRRTALVLAIALLALVAWRLWPQATTPAAAAANAGPGAATHAGLAAPPATARWPGSTAAGVASAASTTPATTGAEADADTACHGKGRQRLQGIRAALDPSRSPDDAFSHAMLADLAYDDTRDEDAQRREALRSTAEWQAARRRWPDDLDIAWHAAVYCKVQFGCDESEALRHLLAVDPDNAAAWLEAMRVAWNRHDMAAYDDALARAAASAHYAPRTGSIFLHLRPLFAAAPMADGCIRQDDAAELAKGLGHAPTADDWASVQALSMELAFNVFASYSALSGCRPGKGRPLPQRRRRDCIAVLSWLGNGDTLVERNVALPLLIQLAGDTPEGRAYRERYRRTLYLWLAMPQRGLLIGDPMRIMAEGELEMLRRAAIAQHRWPPPDDWLPESPRHRMLVTQGRLPPEGG